MNIRLRNTSFESTIGCLGIPFDSSEKVLLHQKLLPLKMDFTTQYSNLSMNTNRVGLRMTFFYRFYESSCLRVHHMNEFLLASESFLSLLKVYTDVSMVYSFKAIIADEWEN